MVKENVLALFYLCFAPLGTANDFFSIFLKLMQGENIAEILFQ